MQFTKRRANFMVTVGLIMNVFVILVLSIGNWLPAVSIDNQPPWQVLQLAQDIASPSGASISGSVELYFLIYATTSGAVIASMLAYVAAQYCDVHLYHFWRNLTKGRHLWLRNNFSTMISQGVDSFMVISVTFGAVFLAGGLSLEQMLLLMGSNYLFKFCAALIDTIPLYIAVHYLRRYLHAE